MNPKRQWQMGKTKQYLALTRVGPAQENHQSHKPRGGQGCNIRENLKLKFQRKEHHILAEYHILALPRAVSDNSDQA